MKSDDDLVRRLHNEGQRAFPALHVELQAFREYCQRAFEASPDAETTRHGAELYLCCACASKERAAMEIMEREMVKVAAAAIARVSVDSEFVRDTLQAMWDQLLTGTHPKISRYSGRGPLRAWLRVVATRVALDCSTTRRKSALHRVELADHLAASDDDPEAQLLRRRYADTFQMALQQAVSGLTPLERNILRLNVRGRCSIDEIARIYGVHRATAARWLERARARVFAAARERITGESQMTPSEFRSMAREIQSGIELTLSSRSRPSTSEPEPSPEGA